MSLLKDIVSSLSDLGAPQPFVRVLVSHRAHWTDDGWRSQLQETKRVGPGMRVLLVEDEPLIAINGDDILRALGVDDVVCVRSVSEGMNALATQQFHAAFLDLRLGQDTSIPLAQRLASINIPFGFLTGFQDNAIPLEFRDRPVVVKPFTSAQLGALLLSLVGPA